MRISGKITFISNLMQVGKDTKIDKKVLCVEEQDDNAQFPNSLAFDFTKDKVALLEGFNIGDIVEVMYNCNHNPREPKNEAGKDLSIFNSIRGRKVRLLKSTDQQAEDKKQKEEDDDLPF